MDTAGRIDKFRQRYAAKPAAAKPAAPAKAPAAKAPPRSLTPRAQKARQCAGEPCPAPPAEKAASAAFFFRLRRRDQRHRTRPHSPWPASPSNAPAARPTPTRRLSPSGRYRALKQFGLVLLCARVGAARARRPRSVEDRGRDVVRHRLRNDRSAATSSRPISPASRSSTARRSSTRWPRLTGKRAVADRSPPHDAARLAAGLLLALTLLLLALAGDASSTAATSAGCRCCCSSARVGLWDRAHQLSPELGLLPGVAAAQYGFALALRRPVAGGVVLGLGVAVRVPVARLPGPALARSHRASRCPLAFATWRTRALRADRGGRARRRAAALRVVAARARTSRARRDLARVVGAQSSADYFAPAVRTTRSADPVVLAQEPALVRVARAAARRCGRSGRAAAASTAASRRPACSCPGTLALVMLGIHRGHGRSASVTYLMPLLVPLALLGALEVDTLKRGFSGALDWFGILTFGLARRARVVALVRCLRARHVAARRAALPRHRSRLPPVVRTGSRSSCRRCSRCCGSLLVRPARRSNRRAVLNWAAGMTLLWALYSTIWLPYLDSRRSYRTVARVAARRTCRAQGCVASRNLGEPQRALF